MSGCAHPRCHGQTGRGRIVCVAHWLALPEAMRAKVRDLLGSRNWDSARIVLHDFYSALYQMEAGKNGHHDSL